MKPRKMKCHKLYATTSACYIQFYRDTDRKKYKYSHTIDIDAKGKPLETVRGEQIFIDVDKKGRVIGIELLGGPKAYKPCQDARGACSCCDQECEACDTEKE